MSDEFPRINDVPDDIPALLLLARRLLEKKDYDHTVAICRQVLSHDAACSQAHFLIASTQRQQRLLPEAREHAKQAVRLDSSAAEMHSLLACIEIELANFDDAKVSALNALDYDSNEHICLYILGLIALQDEDAATAIRHLERAVRLADDQWSYWFTLGSAFQSAKKYRQAIETFYRVLDLRPAFPHTHYHLGCIFSETGRYEEANLAFRTAISLNPVERFVELFQSAALINKSEYDKAVSVLEHLLKLDPTSTHVHLSFGELALRQGYHQDAVDYFDNVIDEDASRAVAYYKKGVALRELGRDVDAVLELSEALRRVPQLGAAQLELNEILASSDGIPDMPMEGLP